MMVSIQKIILASSIAFATLVGTASAQELNAGLDHFYGADDFGALYTENGRVSLSPYQANMAYATEMPSKPGCTNSHGTMITTVDKYNGIVNRLRPIDTSCDERSPQITGVEVSDSGPAGYINVAVYANIAPTRGTVPKIYFSSDSGKTFSTISFVTSTPYTEFYTGYVVSGNDGTGKRPNIMKFGPDGNLYVVYFTAHTNLQTVALNLMTISPTGVVSHKRLVDNINGAPTGAFLHLTTTYAPPGDLGKLVVFYGPHAFWKNVPLNVSMLVFGVVVYDMASASVLQEMPVGYPTPGSPLNGMSTAFNNTFNFIGSDGESIYLMTPGSVGDFVIRRFGPRQDGTYFPNNVTTNPPSAPFTDLSKIPGFSTAVLEQETSSYNAARVYGFGVPRYLSNFTHRVDILYNSAPQYNSMGNDMMPVQTVSIDPDLGALNTLTVTRHDDYPLQTQRMIVGSIAEVHYPIGIFGILGGSVVSHNGIIGDSIGFYYYNRNYIVNDFF